MDPYRTLPLVRLKPAFVEFTGTRGVLRLLRPGESMKRARGLVFDCPRCKPLGKDKEHALIFLFEMPEVPKEAKPLGRFAPTMERWNDGASADRLEGDSYYAPAPLIRLSLQEFDKGFFPTEELTPRDMKCGWKGTVKYGQVRWKTTFWERWRK